MSQDSKRPREPPSVSLESFEFDPSGLNVKWSRNLISTLDGYRIHRCYDLTYIERAVTRGDLPRGFIRQWTTIRQVLHKFAAVGPDVEGVQGWMTRRQSIQFASLILLTFAAPLLVFTWMFRLTYLDWFVTPFGLGAIASVFVAVFASGWYNRKVSWAIFRYLEDNPALFDNERKHLKRWVQTLIWHTSRLIRKDQLKTDKNLVKFWNDDYEGIIVLKKPRGLRKNYVVRLKVEKTESR